MKIIEWLRLPETKNIHDLNISSTTILHGQIIQKKLFLKKLYTDFYYQFRRSISHTEDTLLVELGSGGGFIKNIISNVVTSDVIPLPNIDKCFSALDMPFENNTVTAFFMIDVLHHINDVHTFFKEVNRCLRIGGKLVMIEPSNTLWGGFIWKNFHHEPFDPLEDWGISDGGRLSSANVAIPYIVFYRDRQRFEREFPSLRILRLEPHTPFRYLLSGGVSMKQLLPDCTYNIVKGMETILSPFKKYLGMFLTVEIEKVT